MLLSAAQRSATSMNNEQIRILILEDRQADAELMMRELRQQDIPFTAKCTATQAEFLAELRDLAPDLILSDYSLPGYDGLSALAAAQKERPETPFIFVSGVLGEETAIEALHRGATDCVLKDRLTRLGPAVRRALREIEERVWRHEAEEALRKSEQRWRMLFEYAPDAYFLNDLQGTFVDGNKIAEELIGYHREELIGRNFLQLNLLAGDGLARAAQHLALNSQGKPSGPEEFNIRRKDSTEVSVEIRTYPIELQGQVLVLGIARDLTPRKNAEKTMAEGRRFRKTILDHIPDPAWLKDAQGRFLACNEPLLRFYGRSVQEVIGKTVFDVVPSSAERLAREDHP